MLPALALACTTSTQPPPARPDSPPTQVNAQPAAETTAAAATGRPGRPVPPVALYAAHGDRVVPLGAVPATAPGEAATAVDALALSRWPTEGVDVATPDDQRQRMADAVTVTCDPSGQATAGVALDGPIPHGTLVLAPAVWTNGLLTWPTEGPSEALLAQLEKLAVPTDRVVVANAGDLDGDGQPDRLVLAHGPQVDPEKPAATTVLWWGEVLTPLQGFDFNGGVEALSHLSTPAGPLIVLRSQWMGGIGLHALVVEGSQPRKLGEWVCGS